MSDDRLIIDDSDLYDDAHLDVVDVSPRALAAAFADRDATSPATTPTPPPAAGDVEEQAPVAEHWEPAAPPPRAQDRGRADASSSAPSLRGRGRRGRAAVVLLAALVGFAISWTTVSSLRHHTTPQPSTAGAGTGHVAGVDRTPRAARPAVATEQQPPASRPRTAHHRHHGAARRPGRHAPRDRRDMPTRRLQPVVSRPAARAVAPRPSTRRADTSEWPAPAASPAEVEFVFGLGARP